MAAEEPTLQHRPLPRPPLHDLADSIERAGARIEELRIGPTTATMLVRTGDALLVVHVRCAEESDEG